VGGGSRSEAFAADAGSSEAQDNYRGVLQVLDGIRQESGADKILQRSDLKAMYDESSRGPRQQKFERAENTGCRLFAGTPLLYPNFWLARLFFVRSVPRMCGYQCAGGRGVVSRVRISIRPANRSCVLYRTPGRCHRHRNLNSRRTTSGCSTFRWNARSTSCKLQPSGADWYPLAPGCPLVQPGYKRGSGDRAL
jgi:hypothetical protein